MRTPMTDHSASGSMSVSGSTANLQSRSDSHRDHAYHSQSDREGRSSSLSSSHTQSDTNSETGRYNKARKPINEAVTSAFTAATDTSHTAIPPEIINQITSQITANVLEQLKATSLPPPAPVPAPASGPAHTSVEMPSESQQPTPYADPSRAYDYAPSDRKVYTPPSPHRTSESAAQSQTSPTFSSFSVGSKQGPSSPTDRRPISPFGGGGSITEDSDGREKLFRPGPPKRVSTSGDATILEKIWGKMFSDEGQCTARLGQFLRGIAVHIIEDYEPKHSLVITPEKMQKYYEETKLKDESYSWQDVFDDRTSRISRMFRELEIQHHLIQEDLRERPDIPGITPRGFETWMKLTLRADPDHEFERLAKTALHMPISNPDDRKERFPKEISRRLFPTEPDKNMVTKLERALRSHCGIKLPSRNNSSSDTDPKPPQTAYKTNGTGTLPQRPIYGDSYTTRAPRTSVAEPRTNNNVESAVDDENDEGINVNPIERERKPYVAQPGGGKNYDGAEGAPLSKTSTASTTMSESQAGQLPKLGRSASVTSNGRQHSKPRVVPVAVHQKSQSQANDMPEVVRTRTKSFAAPESRASRNRSPSVTRGKEYGQRSEGDLKSSNYQSSNTADYIPSSYRPERYTQERYEHRPSFSDPRDRGRESRPRYQSSGVAPEGQRPYYTDEDYYRSNAPPTGYTGSDGGYSQYPPSAYRAKG